jgi:hypothetical protein
MKRLLLLGAALPAAFTVCCLHVGCRAVNEPAAPMPLVAAVDVSSTSDSVVRWPGWRGASHHGVADDPRVAVRWTTDEGVRWKCDVPGKGNSSPVVWHDRVLLTSLVESGEGQQLAVLCFDRASGSLLWQTNLCSPAGAAHNRNGHASATPAVDDRRVFVSFGERGLYCLSHAGEQLWHAPLESAAHEWGSAASPVLHQNLVIQLVDGRRDSCLAAFDRATGREVWRTPRDSAGCWSTPVLVTAAVNNIAVNDIAVNDIAAKGAASTAGVTRDELIVNGTGTGNGSRGFVIAYDPATGRELWRVRGTTDIACPTIIAGDGLLFSTSGNNGPVLAIRPGGSGDVTRSHVAWRHADGGPYVPTGVAHGGRLFTISDTGMLRCYNSATGGELWKRRLRGAFTASLIAAAGKIYAVSDQGAVHVLAAADSFQPLAVNPMSEPCFATPAIADGEILLRTDGKLYCIARSPQETRPAEQQLAENSTAPAVVSAEAPSPSDAGLTQVVPIITEDAANDAAANDAAGGASCP